MAIGKELGTFRMRSTSITLVPGRRQVRRLSVNFEGEISGELHGFVIATMTVDSAEGEDGEYTVSSRIFHDGGGVTDAVGGGTTTHQASHVWLVAGVSDVSGGRSFAIKGEFDLASRTYEGKLYERV